MAARLAFTTPIHPVKFWYTSTFHLGLKVATHYYVVVHLQGCASFEISQIQLRSTRYNCSHVFRVPIRAMYAVKFLYTATFHRCLKIATLCFRQMHLP